MFALQAAPVPRQARCACCIIAFAAFIFAQAHAAPLPADLEVIKVEVLDQPPNWTFNSWVMEVVGHETHIYVFYAGNLHNEEHDAIPFEIDVKFSADEGFLLKQVANETFEPKPIKSYTLRNFVVSAATSPSIDFTLVDGTEQESGGVVHFLPLNFRQENMPNVDLDPDNSTDMGGPRDRRMIDPNESSYITGEPTRPELLSEFHGAPQTISVDWRLTVRTERAAFRLQLDDRNIPVGGGFETLAGNAPWDIEAALNEYVGGDCILLYRIDGVTGNLPFRLRGKNPLDEDAAAHIDDVVHDDFTHIRTEIVRHESRQGNRVYNQFNSQNAISGTLNFGDPNGWGISQIDRELNNPGVTTAEVWNWHNNITAYNQKLIDKQGDYNRFIGYFRDAYGTRTNWVEPPTAHQFGQTTLSAHDWGVIVLYNGVGGVPRTKIPGRKNRIRSPWVFNPNNGTWIFHDNANPIRDSQGNLLRIAHYAAELEPEFHNPPPASVE